MSTYREETDFVEYHYYKINRILLSLLKLWPYRQSKLTIINHIINLTLLTSFVVFQLTSFFTRQFTINFLIVVLSIAVPSFTSTVLYCSFYIKSNIVKQMWEDIRNVWNMLKNEAEREIMQKYSTSGELYTKILLLIDVVGIISYAVMLLLPDILNQIFPLNETRPHNYYAVTEYFIDEKTYFYPLLCHWLIGATISNLIVVSVISLNMIYIEHICGMLSVASYRIEHLIDQYTSRNLTKEENCVIYQNISAAVDIHRKALKCSSFLITNFALYFTLAAIIAVVSLSLNFFQVLNAITMQKNIIDVFPSMILIGLCILSIFVCSYYGQKITDHNNEVFYNTYDAKWYEHPPKIQKLFLFIMQNTTAEYLINVYTIIEGSIKGFAKLMSTSVSYFTVIYSIQLPEVQSSENYK